MLAPPQSAIQPATTALLFHVEIPATGALAQDPVETIVPRSLLYVIKLQQALLVESLDISGEFSIRGFDCLLNFAVKPGVALQQVQQGITEVIDELAFRLASSVSEKDLPKQFGQVRGSICFDLVRFGSIGRIRVGLGVPHLNQMERLDTIGTQNWMICIKLKTCQVAKLECEQQLQDGRGLHLLKMLSCQIVDSCFHLFPVQDWQSQAVRSLFVSSTCRQIQGHWSRMIWKVLRQEKMDDNGKTCTWQMTSNDYKWPIQSAKG